jgi:hypothetical protein
MHRPSGVRATVIAALVLLFTGCAPAAPTPSPMPSVSAEVPTPTPIATAAADPLTTVTTLVIRPEALEMLDGAGGIVAELGYLSDAAAAIDSLTVVFGSGSTDEEFPGSSHHAPSTAHRWGGFTLWEPRYVDYWADVESAGTTLGLPAFRVEFTEAQAFGLPLTDMTGRQVGGSWADLTGDPDIQTNPSGCSGPYVDFVAQPVVWPDGTEHVQKVSVDFRPDDDAVSIARIGAPMSVHEEGCA